MDREKTIEKQKKRAEGQEKKLLGKKESWLQRRTQPLAQKVEEKIPPKAMEAYEAAFEKAFEILFEKGEPWVQKTYNKEKIRQEFREGEEALSQHFTKGNLLHAQKSAGRSVAFHQAAAAVEGTALGVLGIGLPDIPLFLGMLWKSLCEICTRYGYSCHTRWEKSYMLAVLCAAVAPGEEQQELSARADQLGWRIHQGERVGYPLESLQRETAHRLALSMSLSKAVQGVPVVGAVGGVVNFRMMRQVSRLAEVKYRKRYLFGKEEKG